MRHEDFENLSCTQQLTLFLSMHIRNELEDFHVKYLNQDQMQELNQTIRYAIYELLDSSDKEEKGSFLVG